MMVTKALRGHQAGTGISTRIRSVVSRDVLLLAPVCFLFSLINLRVKLLLTPSWFDGTLAADHALYLAFEGTNNEQSRILQWYIPELLHQAYALSIEHAYLLQRLFFVFVMYLCFYKYLRRWFGVEGSFAGVAFLAAVIPLTYFNHLQESAPLLQLLFLLGLWAIREHRTIPLLAVFLVGGLTNETMLILPAVYLFYHFRGFGAGELLVLVKNTLLVSLPLLLTIGPIRYVTRDRPHLGGAWHLPDNVQGLWTHLHTPVLDLYRADYLYIFFIFGAFWIYAIMRYRDKPLFLRRAALAIPLFVAAHFITGIIYEVRQMLPLSFLVIPMALFYVFPAPSTPSPSAPPVAQENDVE